MRSITGILIISLLLASCVTGVPRPAQSIPPQAQNQPQIQPQIQSLPITVTITIAQQTIGLEVASTPLQQEIGLMSRTELAADRGMLFPFDPPRGVSFWMKNTLIPLDLIYLHQGVVKQIYTAPPCKTDNCSVYPSNSVIDQVIELPAGRAQALGVKRGDRLVVNPVASKQP
jgi:uncharacterized protein